jgi:hypothetical protein
MVPPGLNGQVFATNHFETGDINNIAGGTGPATANLAGGVRVPAPGGGGVGGVWTDGAF